MSQIDGMAPELERLRDAHREIAEPDPAMLRAVRARALRRRPVAHRRPLLRRYALAGAVATVLAAVTAVSLDGGGPHVDAVAQARAALLPPGAIAHYTVELGRSPEEGPADPRFADCDAGPLEVWRATNPTRWRAVQPVSRNPVCGTMDLAQGLGPITAPRFEVAYADGRTEMYVPGRDLMLVIDDRDAPADGERRAPSTAAAAASIQFFAMPPDRTGKAPREREFVDNRPPDLISDIEQMLAEGDLRDRGESTRGGRAVRVLSGETRRGDWLRTRLEYVVDAGTFAPISATSRSTMTGSGASASTTATFGAYERIPLAGDGADLLEIDVAPHTRVIERTIEQIKRP